MYYLNLSCSTQIWWRKQEEFIEIIITYIYTNYICKLLILSFNWIIQKNSIIYKSKDYMCWFLINVFVKIGHEDDKNNNINSG